MPEAENSAESESEAVSRIEIEFGPGNQADIVRARFENVSLGQMMAFARYAEWQLQRAIAQYERDQQAERERQAMAQGILVPRGGLQ